MAKNEDSGSSINSEFTAAVRQLITTALEVSDNGLLTACLALRAAVIYLDTAIEEHPNSAEILERYCELVPIAEDASRKWAEDILRPVQLTGKGGDA